ncbi:hypothetical protein E4T44_00390 [Aureobasidium sp. EXF-8845]|nr:hypothetical protein E4T44_00390 [Aureobasidium sp. EXF-8845]KAI4857151.1 hypothetical protein E4T45_01364 [Aureobasidium sp. EXF-8846]
MASTDANPQTVFMQSSVQDVERLNAPFSSHDEFNSNSMTSVNWLSMDVGDWDFSSDLVAMSQGFQTTDQGISAIHGQGNYVLEQNPSWYSTPHQQLHTSPDNSHVMHDSPSVMSRSSQSDGHTASTPSSQMDSSMGGLYRHGKGSRLTRQRIVCAKAGPETHLPRVPEIAQESLYQVVNMDYAIGIESHVEERFPVHEDTSVLGPESDPSCLLIG